MQAKTRGVIPTRRGFLKHSALAAGAFFINTKTRAGAMGEVPTSPATTPFLQPLKFPRYAIPLPPFQPLDPVVDTAQFQRYDEFPAQIHYQMDVCEAQAQPHPQLGLSTASTFGGTCPGLTLMMRYGVPALVRMRNCLPHIVSGFGSPEISTHVHNGHHASESDGFPLNLYTPGEFWDFHYPNICAGGDPLEAKSTLWYHDHTDHYTAQNVHRGLAGFFLLFNDKDSGNERDPNPDAYRLPSGVPDGRRVRNRYDIPLMLSDARFNTEGVQIMDVMDMDGYIGDKYLVNGSVQPYFEVERRKYRFRILDGSVARFYDLWFSNSMTFQHIGNDGNLLPAPILANRVRLAPAERADIIVDFSQLPASTTEVFLVNRAEHRDGRGPRDDMLPMSSAPKILKFIVRRETNVPDQSRVPSVLKPLPEMDLPVVRERHWHFDRENGLWTVNGQLFDMNRVDAVIKQGTAEIWNISTSGGWAHPVHMHLEEYRILTHNDKPVDGTVLGGVKDVFALYPGDEMRLYMKFRDWVGKYVMHCHNTIHEDHAMMVRWDVVA
jgi:FtsP/CotA-like multicopper oxidase with cupredoxin domain